MDEHTKAMVDGASLTTLAAALVGYLPAITLAATLIWTLIRIWETKTVQCWVTRCWRKGVPK